MINDVKMALGSILGVVPLLSDAKGAGRIFELYIMTGLAESLKLKGFEVWLERSDGSKIGLTDADQEFVQRKGIPGGVISAKAGAKNASHIVFKHPESKYIWEIWNGIEFLGRSQGTHEIDIAVVPRATGVNLRNEPVVGFPAGRPRLSIECKDVKSSGSSDEMRTLIARLYDLTILNLDGHAKEFEGRLITLAINPAKSGSHLLDRAGTFRDENFKTFNALVRKGPFSTGALEFTGYYHIKPFPHITAKSAESKKLFSSVADWCLQNCI